jgi:hypothetical protein
VLRWWYSTYTSGPLKPTRWRLGWREFSYTSYHDCWSCGVLRTNSTLTGKLIPLISGVRAQADWTLTHTSHKVTKQSTIEASITHDGVAITLIIWSPNEWPSVCREMFWTSNEPAQWTHYIIVNSQCAVCFLDKASVKWTCVPWVSPEPAFTLTVTCVWDLLKSFWVGIKSTVNVIWYHIKISEDMIIN